MSDQFSLVTHSDAAPEPVPDSQPTPDAQPEPDSQPKPKPETSPWSISIDPISKLMVITTELEACSFYMHHNFYVTQVVQERSGRYTFSVSVKFVSHLVTSLDVDKLRSLQRLTTKALTENACGDGAVTVSV